MEFVLFIPLFPDAILEVFALIYFISVVNLETFTFTPNKVKNKQYICLLPQQHKGLRIL